VPVYLDQKAAPRPTAPTPALRLDASTPDRVATGGLALVAQRRKG